MTEYHEPQAELDDRVRDEHRALASLREEIEAVDWYTQRAARCADPELRSVIEHNRDEEIEHACMTLEWLRRSVPEWDQALRTYLFTSGAIVDVEKAKEAAEHAASGAPAAPASSGGESSGRGLGVGSLLEKGARR
jgi:ferritin-like protein